MANKSPAVAAIEYALNTDDGMAFLRCWMHGKFPEIREGWPDAPEEVFIGADPLHPETKFGLEHACDCWPMKCWLCAVRASSSLKLIA